MTESSLQRVIILPWPDRRLSPNARVSRYELARVKKKARADAAWEARIQHAHVLKGQPCDVLHVRFRFDPPSRRSFDADNLIASMKAAIDGVADVIGINDSRWRFTVEVSDEIVPDGKVTLHLAPEVTGRAA